MNGWADLYPRGREKERMANVSVIVPVYKVEEYLHRCVDSILNQTFQDFELILVDDGSPDTCGGICDAYAVRDSRVHVIHQQNGGLSAARNAGIDWAFAHSDSQWLAFIDSDDWIHRDYLKKLHAAAERHNTAVVLCGWMSAENFLEDKDLPDTPALLLDTETAFTEHYDKSMAAWCKLIKRELLSDIRFPVGKLHEDAFVTHKLLFACPQVSVVDEKLYYYYQNPTSITRARWSDRKLHSIEAHEQRLDYFREKGFQRAFRWQQRIYIQELTFKIIHLLETRESPRDHQDSLRLMQGKLRLALKQARKDKAVTMDRELAWAYLLSMRTDFLWKAAMAARSAYHNRKK